MSENPEAPRRRRLRPSRRLLATAGVLAIGLVTTLATIHPFLAVTERVPSRIMVVEGWLPDYALEEALREYRDGNYQRLFTTGAPLERGTHLAAYGDYARLAAATLERLGLAANLVQAVPSAEKHRNRTYATALALKDYLSRNDVRVDSINLFTEGTHARRSRLCFQRALGRHVRIGVVSIENRDYESNSWWRYSSGVKTILSESLALLYAWLSIDYGD